MKEQDIIAIINQLIQRLTKQVEQNTKLTDNIRTAITSAYLAYAEVMEDKKDISVLQDNYRGLAKKMDSLPTNIHLVGKSVEHMRDSIESVNTDFTRFSDLMRKAISLGLVIFLVEILMLVGVCILAYTIYYG